MSSEAPAGAPAPFALDDAAARDALKNFMAMDINGDGQLSADEFRTGLGMLGMDQDFAQILFSSFDTDQSGAINKSEFLAAMAVMLHPTNLEQQVSMAFDAYDVNHDGKLSVEELQHVITAMFGTMVKMGIREEDATPTAAAAAGELYRHMDADAKGHVTKEDYLRLATHNPDMLKRLGLGNRPARGGSRLSVRTTAPGQPVGSLYGVPPPPHARPRRRGRGTGTTVAFGHDNWELVVQMMLAIRLSVGRAMKLSTEAASRSSGLLGERGTSSSSIETPAKAAPKQFEPTTPPSAAGGKAPAEEGPSAYALDASMFADTWNTQIPGNRRGKETSIGFKDYAPLVFRRIRSLFGISDRDYMLSLGPEQILGELLLGTMGSLAELFSEGKSKAFFYFSNDGRYLIKTIPHRELTSLIGLLEKYVAHVESEPFTLLPRFMGAHRIRMPGSRKKKVHFVVMTNVFSSPRVIHQRYDLKGSTHGRTAGADNLLQFPDLVRKDLDVKEPFHLRSDARDALCAQISSDLRFLREVGTMDYSMLCGVHFPQRAEPPDGAEPSSAGSIGSTSGVTAEQVALQLDAAADEAGAAGASGSADAELATLSKPPSHIISQSSDSMQQHNSSPASDAPSDAPAAVPTAANVAAVAQRANSSGMEMQPPAALRSVTDDVRAEHARTHPPHARASPEPAHHTACAQLLTKMRSIVIGPSLAPQSLADTSSPPSPPSGSGGRSSSSAARVVHRDQTGRPTRELPPWADYSDGAMVAARGSKEHSGEPAIYFIGVIDILTNWTCAKSAENVFKTLTHPSSPNAHSCVPPVRYADRFEAALPSWVDGDDPSAAPFTTSTV